MAGADVTSDEAERFGLEQRVRELDYEIEKASERVLYLKRTRRLVLNRIAEVPK